MIFKALQLISAKDCSLRHKFCNILWKAVFTYSPVFFATDCTYLLFLPLHAFPTIYLSVLSM